MIKNNYFDTKVLPYILNIKEPCYNIKDVVERCGVEILGSKINKNKKKTGGVDRKTLRKAYIDNNRCPLLKTNYHKKELIQSLMKC